MRVGNLSTPQGKLSMAMKNLIPRWEDAKAAWHDSVARNFEENHFGQLQEQSVTTIEAMRRLGLVMHQAYQECS